AGLTPCSVEESEPEAEDLFAVLGPLVDREAEVQRDRYRAEHRHLNTDANPGRHAVIVDFHLPLDRPRIDEPDEIDLVAGHHRHLVLDAVQEGEGAADVQPLLERPNAAEREPAHAAEPAGVE